jgi:hypothetical protein
VYAAGVSIVDWVKKLIGRDDEAARERAAARAVESKEERAAMAGGVEGMTADEQAARSMAEGSIEDVDRLGE